MHSEIEREFDMLREAVQGVYDLDIKSTTRERPYVNARITFAYILWERGFNKSEIGRYLGKNHATICHYCKNFEGYIKTDPTLKRYYEEARAVYMDNFDPVYTMERAQLKNEVFSLRKKVYDLYCELEELKRERDESVSQSTRMDSIIRLVTKRTRLGDEKQVERKLNVWFNGLY